MFTVVSWLSVPLVEKVTGSVATTVNNIGIIVHGIIILHMSLVVRNRLFAYAKTKTQISFAVTDSTIPLLPKSEISNL